MHSRQAAAGYPGLTFTLKQTLDPRMSGYAWDSRCECEAGVGTLEFAKTQPTHSVQVFVNTVASEAKAQPDLGPSAYTTTGIGTASAFRTKGQAEIQLLVKVLTLAKSL